MSGLTSLERDTESRNRIVSDINTNLFVEAGAGSGKTTMLVSRMVAMVESGIPIGKICAITFTKAAAGEFYDRFQKLLIERSNPEYIWKDKGYAGQLPKPTDETRIRCAEALRNIDLCFMGTIDSFCSMVLSEHPSEAHIPSDADIISDDDAEVFYKQQYVKICAGEYGEDLAKMAGIFRGFYRNAEDVFVEGESLFMNNRNVHFNYEKSKITEIDKTFATEREDLIKAIKCAIEHRDELMYQKEAKNLAAWERLDDTYKSLRKKWSSNFTSVMYALKSLQNLRLIPEAMNHHEAELSGVFEPGGQKGAWLECSMCKEGGILSKIQDMQYSLSMEFLEACVPVLEATMRDKGNMTFFDYLYYLRNMLKRDAEGDGKLIRYIYDRHSYFLIDEFQDTNPMQAEVFFYLASENPLPKWSKCVPRPGSLFIVGDPKQSIYRFRSADVASFLKVKGLFEQNGGAILSLSRNFRSTSIICAHFNRAFIKMLPEETSDQSRFEEIPIPDPKDDEFQGVYTYKAYTGKLAEEHSDETDPAQIARIIEKLVDNEKYKIRTSNDESPRRISYSDIMVITYGKKKLGPIMAHLDELNIPTRVEGEVPFGSNEALIELYNIYSAVADEQNPVFLYGALTGRLIRLTKEEILAYRTNGGKVSLKSSFDTNSCTDEATLCVASRIEELQALNRKAQKMSPAALFAKIMDDYRIYETAQAENLEVVYYTLELLRNAEKNGLVVTPKDGATYISQLITGKSGEERCLSLNDERDAVHMANLHKVKGLEAPVVILAAAPSFANSNSQRVIHGDDGSEGYIFGLPKKDSEGNNRGSHFETKAFPYEMEAEKASGAAEGQRLVYVAATRARNVLIICDSIQAGKNSEVHKSAWKPLMEDSLKDFFEAMSDDKPKETEKRAEIDSAVLYEDAEKTCVLNDRSMEVGTYTVANPSRVKLSSKISEEYEPDQVMIENTDSDAKTDVEDMKTSNSHKFPALLGTMTHKLMEMLISTGNKVNAESAVSEIIREYRTPSMKPYEEELTKDLSDVAKTMRSGGFPQTNGLPQDILNVLLSAEEVYCEVPFCYKEETDEGKVIWSGIMDVIYRSEGKWHIVDYKTNADGNDLDKKYQGQMGAYIKAFKATTGEDADAKTYHIDI